MADQTRELRAYTDKRIEQLEERINQKLDTILALLDGQREAVTQEKQDREFMCVDRR